MILCITCKLFIEGFLHFKLSSLCHQSWYLAGTPPLPGPSQGKQKPRFALSGTRRELRANRTPFSNINTITRIVNAWMRCTKKSAIHNGIAAKVASPTTLSVGLDNQCVYRCPSSPSQIEELILWENFNKNCDWLDRVPIFWRFYS
mgnify:CR=1 FL=1